MEWPGQNRMFGSSLQLHLHLHLFYTLTVFQVPLEKSHSVKIPTDVSDMNTPQNTPECPQSNSMARRYDSGIWMSQKKTRLMRVGVTVSPAPLNACTDTIHQP